MAEIEVLTRHAGIAEISFMHLINGDRLEILLHRLTEIPRTKKAVTRTAVLRSRGSNLAQKISPKLENPYWLVAYIGAGSRSRTHDLMITNQLLYQLSYAGLARTMGGARDPTAFYLTTCSFARPPGDDGRVSVGSASGGVPASSAACVCDAT